MEFFIKTKYISIFFLVLAFSGCTALNLKPWSTEDIIDGVITSAITGKQTSFGNNAQCNYFKMVGGASYREWIKDGEIACSYKR